jgi:hypothetical protein
MVGEQVERSAERLWKHRFAQTLFEAFCIRGVNRAVALEDAYAHADAQYLVRGLNGPEEEARSALDWIFAEMPGACAGISDGTPQRAGKHNGVDHNGSSQTADPDPDQSK